MKKIHREFAEFGRQFGTLKYGNFLLSLLHVINPTNGENMPGDYWCDAMDRRGNLYRLYWKKDAYQNYLKYGYINKNLSSYPFATDIKYPFNVD